jgi:hypothetical protein
MLSGDLFHYLKNLNDEVLCGFQLEVAERHITQNGVRIATSMAWPDRQSVSAGSLNITAQNSGG